MCERVTIVFGLASDWSRKSHNTGIKVSLTLMFSSQDVMARVDKESIYTCCVTFGRFLFLSAFSCCFIPGSRDRDGTEQHASGQTSKRGANKREVRHHVGWTWQNTRSVILSFKMNINECRVAESLKVL